MELTGRRTWEGITERLFTVAGAGGRPVPGVLWTATGASGATPLVLLGHGGSANKRSPNVLAHRDYFTGEHGLATACIDAPAHGDRGGVTAITDPAYAAMWRTPGVVDDMNTDWARTLDDLLALGEFDAERVGYYGLSLGTMFGLPFVASEPRIRVAVLGLCGLRGSSMERAGVAERLARDAPRLALPLVYHVQWDDERFDRDSALELYDLIASEDKRLQSTPGLHGGISADAVETLRRFMLARVTAPLPAPVA
jgi:pimeloyl-ACP methyl ester carboxylesterase